MTAKTGRRTAGTRTTSLPRVERIDLGVGETAGESVETGLGRSVDVVRAAEGCLLGVQLVRPPLGDGRTDLAAPARDEGRTGVGAHGVIVQDGARAQFSGAPAPIDRPARLLCRS
jgi:hypothetical protein